MKNTLISLIVPVYNVEKYVDYLLKDEKENTSRIVDMGIKGGKRAELICRVLESKTVEPYGELTLAEIELLTGRHHQIRVQMAHAGMSLLGDRKYNPEDSSGLPLGLCSCHLVFRHPVTGKKLEFQVTPKGECFAGFPNI